MAQSPAPSSAPQPPASDLKGVMNWAEPILASADLLGQERRETIKAMGEALAMAVLSGTAKDEAFASLARPLVAATNRGDLIVLEQLGHAYGQSLYRQGVVLPSPELGVPRGVGKKWMLDMDAKRSILSAANKDGLTDSGRDLSEIPSVNTFAQMLAGIWRLDTQPMPLENEANRAELEIRFSGRDVNAFVLPMGRALAKAIVDGQEVEKTYASAARVLLAITAAGQEPESTMDNLARVVFNELREAGLFAENLTHLGLVESSNCVSFAPAAKEAIKQEALKNGTDLIAEVPMQIIAKFMAALSTPQPAADLGGHLENEGVALEGALGRLNAHRAKISEQEQHKDAGLPPKKPGRPF